VALGVFAAGAYFLLCFQQVWTDRLTWWGAFGNWKMFTSESHTHIALEAEAQYETDFVPLDLERLFPSRWDSGPRYARSSFIGSRSRMRLLAAAACGRDPGHPERIRLYEVRWRATLGRLEQPRRKEKKKQILDWRCGADAHPLEPRWVL
jgi:hypothetical protein